MRSIGRRLVDPPYFIDHLLLVMSKSISLEDLNMVKIFKHAWLSDLPLVYLLYFVPIF